VELYGLMSADALRVVIGYKVFDTGEECYEYSDDATLARSG